MTRRFDRGEFRKPKRMDSGFLRAEGFLTRIGVFGYRESDGSTRRELRLPEEVFHPDSLDTIQAAPLTNEHPDEAVTSRNVRRLSVGTIGTDARRDGDFIRGTVMVTDAETVAQVDAGKKRELSCGYDCRLDHTPGTHPTFGAYDAIQRDIRHNHVALVVTGKAGPEASLRLDAGDAVMVEAYPPPSPTPQVRTDSMDTISITIDGVTHQVSKATADALTASVKRRDSEIAELTTSVETQTAKADEVQAKLDASEEKVTTETARADTAEKPETLREAVKARLGLERSALLVLGEAKVTELKLDTLEDDAIRKAVILHASPDVDLAEKSEAYIQARFDAAIEGAPEAKADAAAGALGALRVHVDAASTTTKTDEKGSQAAMVTRNRGRWDARDRVEPPK